MTDFKPTPDQMERMSVRHTVVNANRGDESYDLHRFRVRWMRWAFGRYREKGYEVGQRIDVPWEESIGVVHRRPPRPPRTLKSMLAKVVARIFPWVK